MDGPGTLVACPREQGEEKVEPGAAAQPSPAREAGCLGYAGLQDPGREPQDEPQPGVPGRRQGSKEEAFEPHSKGGSQGVWAPTSVSQQTTLGHWNK